MKVSKEAEKELKEHIEKSMEAVKTRGRPKTGQKVYKNVGFRLEEKLYNKFEELAQEKSGVSIHTYIRDNLTELFNEDFFKLTLPNEMLVFLEKLEDTGEQRKTLKKINSIVQSSLADYIFDKMIKLFKDEYQFYRPEGYEENEYSGIRIEDIMYLIDVYNVGSNPFSRESMGEIIKNKIHLFLKKYPTNNKLLMTYFIDLY